MRQGSIPGSHAPPLRAARLAVLAIFFLNGFAFASFVVRIPAVQEKLALGEGLLGLALLGVSLGSLSSMPITGWLVSRFGSRPLVGIFALLFPLALVLAALAPVLAALVAAFVLVGATGGLLDVSMNAHASTVEKGYGRRIMSTFHAAFSFGGLAGAASGGLVASLGIGVVPHILGVAALSVFAAVFVYASLLPAGADRGEPGDPAFARPTRALVGLGVISFCVLLGEGAMADWSAVYLSSVLSTGPGLAAAGYAAFSLTMATGRLFGDRLADAVGPTALVRLGGTVAAAGLAFGLVVATPAAALVGFAGVGLGLSVIFPTALGAAGRAQGGAGPAIAAVSTAGYFGFLVGPPTIGFVAEGTSLGSALFLVVALCAAVAVLAGAVGRAARKGA
ncbi:MFS transporter [Rubrobacter marinus]|uniref:MFS transporter n=1 Tax=Rubrobacter marinus TaxID=2653852 RepID=A0A6G8PTV4_9ACTN|nr:MFS transporter [Rubrobacter marinus]QIN77627.1 MFS transporter [Rubrobacter marinus]